MRFAALGPLHLLCPGEIRPSAAKQRAVLAVLLISVNRVVSLPRLVDELWEDPPVTAPNLVRQYVSRLRKILANAGAGAQLRTHTAGYRLMAPRVDSDVQDFERLVQIAREQLAGGEPAPARESVERALALWRGPAFADVPAGPAVAAEQIRLDELRTSAEELSAEAGLGAGRLAESIGELKALVARHPMRERARASLMVALSASGRKAEALATYRSARAVMAAELGLDPSPQLRRLEHTILADEVPGDLRSPPLAPADPTSATAAQPEPPVEHSTAPAPPPELSDFTGREDQLAQLDWLLSPGPDGETPAHPAVVVSGLPGIGKTVVAVQLAHELRPRFPDGQLFLPLGESPDRAAELFDVLGDAVEMLGCPPNRLGFQARRERFHALLAGRRVLVVLDGAVDEQQVRPLLTGRGGSAVLVTSRSPLTALDGAKHVALPPFSPAEAAQLVEQVVGVDQVRAEPDATRVIAEACGGLPLAVRVAASRVGTLPHRGLRHVADQLVSDRIFDELAAGDLRVADLVGAAYSMLDPDSRQLVSRLAAESPPRAALSEQELGAPGPVVDRLVEAGVLEVSSRCGQARFRCAELVRRYAGTDRIAPPAGRT